MILPADTLKSLVLKTGVISQTDIDELQKVAESAGDNLENALIENNIISDHNLGLLIADSLKMPFVILSNIAIPDDVLHLIPEKIAKEQHLIAFARDVHEVKVATSNLLNTEVRDMLGRKTGETISVYYATQRDIENALHAYHKDLKKTFEELFQKEVFNGNAIHTAPIAKIVDTLIAYAYEDKASDIHIEPQEKDSLIRFRIDGVLHDMIVLPKALHDQIITRIKVLSSLRTDEHLSAQDGKMRVVVEHDNLDLRVSILPVVDGEKVVMRLLSSQIKHLSLIDLGMSDTDLKKVTRSFTKSFGMILSTGPTGSGKTTSIYSIIKILNTREKNITTIEDPVEYKIKGINQIHVNAKTNMTFANGLRSILRQDPNVIFVGEIRDSETAGIAVNAALTGHLVLSTLHTNDAAGTLPRLIDMGIEPFLVASTVNVIIGQRLVRRICDMCKTSISLARSEVVKNISEDVINKFFGTNQEIRVYKGNGCHVCHNTGFTGRVGIFEVLEITPAIRALIIQKKDSDAITQQAVTEGMELMLSDGVRKVSKGMTTFEEVLRITKTETL